MFFSLISYCASPLYAFGFVLLVFAIVRWVMHVRGRTKPPRK